MNKNVVSSIFNDSEILEIIAAFNSSNELIGDGKRNIIKNVLYNDEKLTVKSFKKPHIINSIVYRFFRKTKAERSYRFAKILFSEGIGTPNPIGYVEYFNFFGITNSYYISSFVECDLTFRELNKDLNNYDSEAILKAFTNFTFKIHEKNILFHDHSPGNTLIKKNNSSYDFFLVDLNRMSFKKLSLNDRIKNFSRLTIHRSIIETMSVEYSKLIGTNYNKVFDLMWSSTQNFQRKFHKKKLLKRKIKFWKK